MCVVCVWANIIIQQLTTPHNIVTTPAASSRVRFDQQLVSFGAVITPVVILDSPLVASRFSNVSHLIRYYGNRTAS